MKIVRPKDLGGMIIVACAAPAAYALWSGSLQAYRAAYTAMIFLLAFSAVAAWSGRQESGGFWAGFAVFGSAYFLMTIHPRLTTDVDSPPAVVNTSMMFASRCELVASRITDWRLSKTLAGPHPDEYYYWDAGSQLRALQHRILAIHCLISAGWGMMGGLIGMGVGRRDRTPRGTVSP